jgi:hypothetical protein
MEKPGTVCQVPPITFEEFRRGWIKATEKTSSNGPHFGHYKASMHHPQIAHLLYKGPYSLWIQVTHQEGIGWVWT